MDVQLALPVELREPLVDVLRELRAVVVVRAVLERADDSCELSDDDDELVTPLQSDDAAAAADAGAALLGGRDSFAYTHAHTHTHTLATPRTANERGLHTVRPIDLRSAYRGQHDGRVCPLTFGVSWQSRPRLYSSASTHTLHQRRASDDKRLPCPDRLSV